MQKYVYVRSPMKAARLVDAGFSYMKAPFEQSSTMFIFPFNETLIKLLNEDSVDGRDYMIRTGALLVF